MERKIYNPPASIVENTLVTAAQYEEMYARSISDPDGFWGEMALRLDWITPFTKVKNTTFQYPDVSIKWFEDGELNVCANCIDRHLEALGDKTAIIWEPDEPSDPSRIITYNELHKSVSRLANVLTSIGVKKG
ncbi:MAG: acetyl-coenzyme A synthetase, partial [Devosiaceae bacterium]|nr:acetyl-coenzyme A synthetase [Devosiaceae bacterium]